VQCVAQCDAVCYRVLQCSVLQSVLQHAAVCHSVFQCSVLQYAAVWYGVLQCAIVCCNAVCCRVCCNVPQCAILLQCVVLQRAAVCLGVLQCAAVCCRCFNVLQSTVLCSVLQCFFPQVWRWNIRGVRFKLEPPRRAPQMEQTPVSKSYEGILRNWHWVYTYIFLSRKETRES